jgi:hypothetical protein
MMYSRKDEDYTADFCLVSKRYLNESEYRVFRAHILLGADWRLCCQKLQIDRGTFFHSVYRIQQKLGRAFRELEPYSLFPIDEYFAGKIDKGMPGAKVIVMPAPAERRPAVSPPLWRKLA